MAARRFGQEFNGWIKPDGSRIEVRGHAAGESSAHAMLARTKLGYEDRPLDGGTFRALRDGHVRYTRTPLSLNVQVHHGHAGAHKLAAAMIRKSNRTRYLVDMHEHPEPDNPDRTFTGDKEGALAYLERQRTGRRTTDIARARQFEFGGGLSEGLTGVTLSEPRHDSMQRQLMHFDIMHQEHGKIGTLSGGRYRVGGELVRHEMEPGVEYSHVPRNVKRGGKTAFMITGVGVDRDAVARIHGIEGYDSNNPYKTPDAHRRVLELTPHVLGASTVRELGRQLRKKTRVTMISGNTRISGVRKKVGKTSFQDVSPLPFRESRADEMIRARLHGAR